MWVLTMSLYFLIFEGIDVLILYLLIFFCVNESIAEEFS